MQLIPLLINFTSFAQLQIKDKLRTFPRREGFTRNKEKISNLICLKPFLIPSLPYALPFQGKVKGLSWPFALLNSRKKEGPSVEKILLFYLIR